MCSVWSPLCASEPPKAGGHPTFDASPWPQELSDLKPDPTARWGRLENGLRYIIVPHPTPSQRVSMCLIVEAGSYAEHDDERGYAHYVEHMAFRGSQQFPGDSMIQTLQRFGLPFGAHVNAETAPFHTDFRLENIPLDEPEALPTAMKALRSIADSVLFDEQAVKSELGVILSEIRERNGMIAHAWYGAVDFLTPWSRETGGNELRVLFDRTRLLNRLPLGDEKILAAATAAKLRGFYDRWYRPERMILVITGDLQPQMIDDLVRHEISSLAPRGRSAEGKPPAVQPSTERTDPFIALQIANTEETTTLAICSALPNSEPDSAASRRRALVRYLAMDMLMKRLRHLAERPDAPFASAETLLGHELPGLEIAVARVTVSPACWPSALAALDIEIRRAVQFGFSPSELESAKVSQKNAASEFASRAGSLPAPQLARALAVAVSRSVVFTAAADDERLTLEHLASIKLEECSAILGQLFSRGKISVLVAGPSGPGIPERVLARETLLESGKAVLTPYVSAAASKPFPYTSFGPLGKIVKEVHSAALDADLIEFSNGVLLNLKQTVFEPDHVRYMIRFGGGGSACPPDKPGLQGRLFSWILGGLRALSPEEEHAAMASLSGDRELSFTAGDFRITGTLVSLKMALAFQDYAAYFVDPAFREEAWSRSLEIVHQQLARYENTASGVAENAVLSRVIGGQRAMALPAINEVSERTLEEFKTWFLPQLSSAPIELSVVGDFDRAAMIDAVAHTFGSLRRNALENSYTKQREVTFPAKPFSETLAFKGDKNAAVVCLVWPMDGLDAVADFANGLILKNVLEDRLRLKLRAEMGETYAPSLTMNSYEAFRPSPTFLQVVIGVAPSRTRQVAEAARDVVLSLARDGATPEEFERSRRPLLRQQESNLHDNEWWLGLLGTAQSFPIRVEEKAEVLSIYQQATAEKVTDLARRYLSIKGESSLFVVPDVSSGNERLTASDYIERGNDKIRQGDFKGAVSDFDQVIALSPTLAAAYGGRAIARLNLKDIGGGIADLDHAIQLSPDFVGFYIDRAGAKRSKGDFASAILDYDHVLALKPDSSIALYNRGLCKDRSGDHAGAIADFSLFISRNPNDADGYGGRAEIEYSKGDFRAAFSDIDKVIMLTPTNVSAFRMRANIRRKLGDKKGALADDAEAKQLTPRGGKK